MGSSAATVAAMTTSTAVAAVLPGDHEAEQARGAERGAHGAMPRQWRSANAFEVPGNGADPNLALS